MDKKTYLNKRIEFFEEEKKDLYNQVKEYCQDKNNPLKDRWEIFIDSELGDIIGSIIYFKSVDMDDYLSNMYRYETIDLDYIIELVSDSIWRELKDENPNTSEDELEILVEERLIPLKEEILENFVKSFVFDW